MRNTVIRVFGLCLILLTVFLHAGIVRAQINSPSWTGVKVPAEGFESLSSDPAGLAWDGAEFWVVNNDTHTIDNLGPDGRSGRIASLELGGLSFGSIGDAGPIVYDSDGEGLWVVDQTNWTIRLVRVADNTDDCKLDLPPTGLGKRVPITGITIEPASRALWICMSAGHCSNLWKIENPCVSYHGHGERERVRVQVDIFPRSDPRGLAWIPSVHGVEGCVWSSAHNGSTIPSQQTSRHACYDGDRFELDRLANSLEIREVVPWRNLAALTYADGDLWAAFRADRAVGQPAMILPLRIGVEACRCD